MLDYTETDTTGSSTVVDIAGVAECLSALGVRCALWADKLYIGRVCIHVDGRVTVDSGAGEQQLRRLLDLLRAGVTLDPEPPPSAAAKVKETASRPPRRIAPRELRGRPAQAAVQEFIAACEAEMIEFQRLRPGCWIVEGCVLYHPTSGRVRPIDGPTLPGRGLVALRQTLVHVGVLDVPVLTAAE
ncbi:MAG: hypothetical protein ACJ8AT_33020 [Hyalangium sp.]|uniref:hypothetical protein n=1 Tax=Hyalangium sp. TaxID=2028555 RepID=UPI00389AAD6B